MLEAEVNVTNRLGLHARAAAQLVRLAGQFKSDVKLMRSDNNVVADAKSILSVLRLAAACGALLKIEVDGADEQKAIAAIKELFTNGFGEI
jgi:phosphotransferase system HPr (HPr) family protein